MPRAKSPARMGRDPAGRCFKSAMVMSPVPQQISRIAASGLARMGRKRRAAKLREGGQMSAGEVAHMHVVADAGPIRGRVIGAKDRQWRAAAQGGVDRQRDQVGFR